MSVRKNSPKLIIWRLNTIWKKKFFNRTKSFIQIASIFKGVSDAIIQFLNPFKLFIQLLYSTFHPSRLIRYLYRAYSSIYLVHVYCVWMCKLLRRNFETRIEKPTALNSQPIHSNKICICFPQKFIVYINFYNCLAFNIISIWFTVHRTEHWRNSQSKHKAFDRVPFLIFSIVHLVNSYSWFILSRENKEKKNGKKLKFLL